MNIRIKTCCLLIMLSLCLSKMKAQQPDGQILTKLLPKEEIELLTNSKIFLSGETLEYAINSHIDHHLKSLSDIVYVELVSNTKENFVKHKLRLVDGKAHGDYFIPSSLKTGHYKLIAYTHWSLNNEESPFRETDIYIINPFLNAEENNLKHEFDKLDAYIDISMDSLFAFNPEKNIPGFAIRTDAESYKTRSKVHLKIKSTSSAHQDAIYTILVKKMDSIVVDLHNIPPSVGQSSKTSQHLPEMRGELIHGNVTNTKMNTPAANQAVSLSIPGNHFLYKSAKTDKNGDFYFNIFESHEQEDAIIQVVAENRADYKLTLEPVPFDRYNDLQFYPLKLHPNLKPFIVQHSIYNQIESAYYNLKQDSLPSQPPGKLFYGKPDLVYVLDDFTRFNSVRETFVEVVRGAAIRDRHDGYQFKVYDINDQFNALYDDKKPLVLFNGLQIQDERFVVDYNVRNIESISLVSGIHSIGSVIYNGIIDIKLKKPAIINLDSSYLEQIELTKPLPQKIYYKQNYVNSSNRIPDFRTQLFWQPNLKLDSDSVEIDFYTSDVPGDYIIEIKGTAPTGNAIILTKRFKVIE